MTREIIEIIHANENNLKNISVNIPKKEITIITGLSGSGKSSLIFDTLAAESQRMLNDTYSSYIQQLLPHYGRPNVEKINNLPVSIIIDQKKIGGNARSTVGTATDIYTLLRLLFSRIGKPFVGYSMNFSFNNTNGMCPHCQGLGVIKDIDIHKLIDFDKSLNDGAIKFPTFQPGGWRLSRYTESGYFDIEKPIKDYSDLELNTLLYEEEKAPDNPTINWHKTAKYVGLIPRIRSAFLEKDQNQYKKEIEQIVDEQICPNCNGKRLNDAALSCKINNKSIGDCADMSISELNSFLQMINEPKVQTVIDDLLKRLNTLEEVGLDYLTLNRTTNTLSGGESQRIKMSKHLNSSLCDVLYIFDEPSIGLHPHDITGINKIFEGLKEKGNTVIIVEHDPDVIKIADHIIDMGPGSGGNGGNITFQGTYKELLNSDTATGNALFKKHNMTTSNKEFCNFYELNNANMFNLKNISIKIPKNALTIVTGVAGSGKSTLITHLFRNKYPNSILLDQKRIHTSSRSIIATYMGFFDKIRTIFGKTNSKSPSLFSFIGEGSCPLCKGKGIIKTDLAFMDDVEETCELCEGTRYKQEISNYKYSGYTISDILNLSIDEALEIFIDKDLKNIFNTISEANLGYIKLGQSLDTMSGGELQRLKIAATLLNNTGEIYILDEPSTGLHESDIKKLIQVFNKLINKGKTVIILEHNLSIMCQADWIIDLGPLGGFNGGDLIYMGYPNGITRCTSSVTGKRLLEYTS
ncbi:ATP-binding cassette domain-containing protein [Clostridium beijerinckii]|uniref:ATP-binding cassette domain-containing protein n=1 Tax=Clostridium beijerinckii TaxID=1520 RepID=UPI00098CD7BA|nr:excinuclease ABC subunit UvrA [Clostridium beijerinckii]MBA8934615.1 excinuclease UvrABC ATPase subunit [Clostridium beijerinckii]NRU38800.1 excinuclease UvrABC ATPase subunit [Clostridium beijerinckii]NSA97921.1 excinuclease UvrABC ATPase subunit [Clostridium beijerinckii]OOM63972.1 UvrABC system protein A [Clostridium beijerinckii]OOM64457.1 UvrABC system protein A [Clostridium beijerinckii]